MKQFSRRDLLKGAVAASAVIAAGSSSSAISADADHSHMHHASANGDVIDAALGCVKNGQACLDHCMELFKAGDNSVANCADKVTEMLAMCTALSQMASYQSKHLDKLAKVCIDTCEDCKKACEEHADKHQACKNCADSCEECIDACKKIAA